MWNTDGLSSSCASTARRPEPIFALYDWGSSVPLAGANKLESDIDLLFEFEPGSDGLFNKTITLRHLLQASFHREVDICREEYAKLHLRSRFLKEAIYA